MDKIRYEEFERNPKDNAFRISTTVGSTVIACGWCDDKGLLYSEDNGKTWNQSNITSGNFSNLVISNNIVVVSAGTPSIIFAKEERRCYWELDDYLPSIPYL